MKMSFNKINWGLSIILFTSVTSCVWTKTRELKDDSFKYGENFNKTRDSLNIPLIEKEWITHEWDSVHRFWAKQDKSVTTSDPIHLNKVSIFTKDKLISESDEFHYEFRDSLAYKLITKYTFDTGTWECEIIKYRRGKYPPSEFWTVSLDKADSVLNTWGLGR